MGETYLTKKGLAKLRSKHKSLLEQKRQLTEEVSKAAAMGDLSENAEYHAARERLQHVAARLAELDEKFANVRIIDELKTKSGEARVGMSVTLEDEETKENVTYVLVGPEEADPESGRLSIASPLGKALLGKKQDEKFELILPKATVPYRVVEIKRAEVP